MRISYCLLAINLLLFDWTGSEGEELKTGAEDIKRWPESLSNLVHTYIELREYDRARSLVEEFRMDFGKGPILGRTYLLIGDYEKALESLKEDGDPFQIGYCHERLEEFEEAIRWYEKASEQDSLLRDYYLLRKGTCELLGEDYEEATAVLRALEENFPLSPLISASYEEMASAFEGLGEMRKANWLRKLIGRRWPAKKPKMQYLIGMSLEGEGKKREAETIYYGLVKRFPDSDFALKALKRLKDLTSLVAADLFYAGRVLYYQGEYREAATDLQSYLNTHPDGRLAKQAQDFLGKAFYRMGDYRRALGQFQTIVKKYRREPISLKAQFNVGRCQDRLGREDLAVSSYERLVRLFPRSHLTDDALYRIGRYYEGKGDLDRALATYWRLIEEVPTGDFSDDALFRIGLTNLQIGEPESAASQLRELLAKNTPLLEAATYWLARSLEEGGKDEEAAQLYQTLSSANPTSFYSICARERLALSQEDPISFELSEQEPTQWLAWAETSPLSPEQTSQVLRGERLLKLGFLEEGSQELKKVRNHDPAFLYYISSLFSKYGCDSESIRYGSRVFWKALSKGERNFPRKLMHILYPTPYWITVEEWAEDFGIDPFLLLALIREESLFNPKAISRAGAVGLTQVIPSTGKKIAESLAETDFEIEDLQNPEKSIKYGSFYLSRLLEDFGGRAYLALAAYNGGPQNVKEWLKRNPDPERDWFIEEIPFWETRGYVKKVLSSFWVYRLLY